MSDIAKIVDTYLAMWNETDPARRAQHIEAAWTHDGRYVDPLSDATGPKALSEMVTGVQTRFPGQKFRRISGIDVHHDQVRFAWELAASDGTVTVVGLDVGALSADGRLRQITGFFGDLPKVEG